MTFAEFKDSFIIALPYFMITNTNNVSTNANVGGNANFGVQSQIEPEGKMIVAIQRIG